MVCGGKKKCVVILWADIWIFSEAWKVLATLHIYVFRSTSQTKFGIIFHLSARTVISHNFFRTFFCAFVSLRNWRIIQTDVFLNRAKQFIWICISFFSSCVPNTNKTSPETGMCLTVSRLLVQVGGMVDKRKSR